MKNFNWINYLHLLLLYPKIPSMLDLSHQIKLDHISGSKMNMQETKIYRCTYELTRINPTENLFPTMSLCSARALGPFQPLNVNCSRQNLTDVQDTLVWF